VNTLPLWVRKFLTDFIETGIAAIFAIQIVLPQDEEQAVRVLAIFAGAVGGALISAARRALPGFYAWVREKLQTTDQP
jgi:branched-subunit amino acid transport protein